MVPPTLAAPQQQLGQVVVAPQIAAPLVAMTTLDPRFQPLPLQPGETAFYPSGERKRAKQARNIARALPYRSQTLALARVHGVLEGQAPLHDAPEAALQSLPPLPPLQPMPPSAVGLEDLWGGAQGLQPGAAPNSPTVGAGAGMPAVAPVAAPDQASLTAALCSSYSMHLQRSLADSMSLSRMLAVHDGWRGGGSTDLKVQAAAMMSGQLAGAAAGQALTWKTYSKNCEKRCHEKVTRRSFDADVTHPCRAHQDTVSTRSPPEADFEAPSSDDVDELGRSRGSQVQRDGFRWRAFGLRPVESQKMDTCGVPYIPAAWANRRISFVIVLGFTVCQES
ncbi:hypothetical protein EMIHUDRAFT_452805 [Emiliania huxleyi CCMP1516]|uniref:Uncharacterized protein n=2 Tax=Emiliania huxleyi TaxID=2903 RepID=A0A0D3IEQ4_EMIH1|nr:hypothetical protein EMIHUDRAFT_452805 [Emiliania huxleyi CCMP1516]EOD09739.1 hypothetical protein EMIHUDRAFT_452805 [Emiliania huxleyi CCMP1516]|eukprot:XP_005762168.1 hypothetical protein EMIHUDRAFT_452805 [Emiliania huxleyi CCMP1516]